MNGWYFVKTISTLALEEKRMRSKVNYIKIMSFKKPPEDQRVERLDKMRETSAVMTRVAKFIA